MNRYFFLCVVWTFLQLVSVAQTDRKYDFVVAADGSGDYTTVQEAINAIPDYRKAGATWILIKKGIYKGKMISEYSISEILR